MVNLQDFCFYFTDEKEIDAFAAADGTMGGQEQKIQTTRIRRAWAAAKQKFMSNKLGAVFFRPREALAVKISSIIHIARRNARWNALARV